jgi:LytS/YehU family sensor histidine kinase
VLDNLMTGHLIITQGHLPVTKIYLYQNVYRGTTFIGLSVAYFLTVSLFRSRERVHVMASDQLRAVARNLDLENKYIAVENAFLQNQISPHLLFNSLNFIYNSVYLLSERAGKGVIRLAELMHYSLVSADGNRKVMLAKEVKQVENLIALCSMRFPDEFFLRFRKKGRLTGLQIIPLVLLTLVENMMKHGDIGERKRPANIKLEVRGNQLLFETDNKKRNSSLYQKGGLGLKNMEKRLNNFYGDRYTLLIRDMEDLFTVSLKIEL